METKLFLIWCIWIIAHEAFGQQQESETRVSLESIDYGGSYLRACTNKVVYLDNNIRLRVLCTADVNTFKRESTFIMREPGLTGDPGTVSFESVEHPDYYISNNIIVTIISSPYGPSRDPGFRMITTFHKLVGRVNGDNFFTLESVVVPNFFLRHCSGWFGLWFVATSNNVDLCIRDAATFDREITFKVVPPLAIST